MSSKILNSNPWIQPNQVDHFSLDDFNPVVNDYLSKAKSFSEYGDTTLNIELTLRRNLDAFESGQRNSLRDLSSFKKSNELLDLSYQELNSYLSGLDHQRLIDVYGASPWDIQNVKDFLKINKLDITNEEEQIAERRTIKFKVSAKEFESIFTDGDLVYNQIDGENFYINKNHDFANTFLHAQGELSEQFSDALIGFKITPETDKTTLDPDDSDSNPHNEQPKIQQTYFYPQEVAAAYNFPELKDSSGGNGVRIGLVGSGGNQAMRNWHRSDQYREYLIKQGINPLSPTVERTIPQSLSSEKDTDDVREQMLDVSVLRSIAPNAQIIASAEYDYAELIYLDKPVDIISSSTYVRPTKSHLSPAIEELYVDALLRQITVVVAAGDQGSMNLMSGGILWPFGEPLANSSTSSAAVLSIGGTSFSPNLNQTPFTSSNLERDMVVDGIAKDLLTRSIDDQNMWNGIELTPGFSYTDENGITIDNLTVVGPKALIENDIGSSGSWNRDDHVLNAGYQQQILGDDMDDYARKFPDISFLAGGYFEKGTSNWYTIGMPDNDKSPGFYKFDVSGGTSAGAPLTAGLLAVIAGDLKEQNGPQSRIGFINPLLYEGYASDRRDDLFFDVPAGSNNANVFKVVDDANWEKKYISRLPGSDQPTYLNGTGPGGSLDTSLSQTGYGFDDASGLGSLDGKELLNYLTEIHASL
ncbi:hypothetical protein N8563_01215 [bacterium]|nr:hypothetical protein [bacterium]